MRHRPHVYLPRPWPDGPVALSTEQAHHLTTVVKHVPGDSISYTDGVGTFGIGVLGAVASSGAPDRDRSGRDGLTLERGAESQVPHRRPRLTLGVAPPRSKDRQRFVVEKLQELGAAHLVWVSTAWTQTRPPKPERSHGWAVAALEQSRGSWLMAIDASPIDDIATPYVALPGGENRPAQLRHHAEVTVLIGPEAGFRPDEVAKSIGRIDLGPTILRTETAAIAVAVGVLGGDA
ncbi:MAG: RsmE family RNA methyltransferase [Acidimicrobiia bacterium]|nr:RsmE family RNA methyltransferase [Acidimicrobiia bacterium]